MKRVQAEDLRKAAIDGLEECPFCDFRMIIENKDDKVFHCQNPACGKETCRKCKKLAHLPKTCEEVGDEKHQDSLRMAVEKAMDEARIRRCYQCSKVFVKVGLASWGMVLVLLGKTAAISKLVKKAAQEAEAKWRAEHPEAARIQLTIKGVVEGDMTNGCELN
ncbi:putative ring finger [Paratrimastix pyriformis]|uniref:Ring finger n=1 Tax=Paratrimastix pyriformis TaxID=342808 RepID=A0ABQ8UIE7_9EUKA|nr:putative ring finger [Paratrimastix pyriformis]